MTLREAALACDVAGALVPRPASELIGLVPPGPPLKTFDFYLRRETRRRATGPEPGLPDVRPPRGGPGGPDQA